MILKSHAETIAVIGYNRVCIYDLPRRTYDFIPIDINIRVNSLINVEENIIHQILDYNEKQWLDYLIDNEYFFYTPIEFKDCFPPIDLTWQSASKITNAIIDFESFDKSMHLKFLEDVNCFHIILRFFNITEFKSLANYLKKELFELTFQYVEIIIEHSESVQNFKNFKKYILKELQVLSKITIFKNKKEKKQFKPQFIVSIETFIESQKNNLYFNRKLYIDNLGNFKNGVETNDILANKNKILNVDDFEQIIIKSNIKQLWNINKSLIDVCKDCEFRFMCIDNRVPIKRFKNEYFNEIECEYNPYISKWFGEDSYKTLQEINIISDQSGFHINHSEIKKINEEIWVDD